MTLEEMQWDAKYEQDDNSSLDGYDYREEAEIEAYYNRKEGLFERLADSLRPY